MLDIIINIITHTHTRTQTTGSHAHTNGRLTPSLCFRASCVCFSQQQGVFAGCIGCAVWTVAEAASSHPRTRKHLHVLGGGAVHPSQRGRTVFPHRRPRVRALGVCAQCLWKHACERSTQPFCMCRCLPNGPHFSYSFLQTTSSIVEAVFGAIGVTLFQSVFSTWRFQSIFWVRCVYVCAHFSFRVTAPRDAEIACDCWLVPCCLCVVLADNNEHTRVCQHL